MDRGERGGRRQDGDNAVRDGVPGTWLVLAAAALWGTPGTAQSFAPPGVSPLAVGVVRLVLGGVLLLLLAWGRGRLHLGTPWPRQLRLHLRCWNRPRPQPWASLFLASA